MVPRGTAPASLGLESAVIRDPLVVSPDTLVMAAIDQMAALQLTPDWATAQQVVPKPRRVVDHLDAERASCVIVVDSGYVCGLLTEQDVVRLIAQQCPLRNVNIYDVMTPPSVTLSVVDFTNWDVALKLLHRHHIRHLPLVDAQDHLIGLVTQGTLQAVFNCRQHEGDEPVRQALEVPRELEERLQHRGQRDDGQVHQPVAFNCSKPDCIKSAIKKQAMLAAIPDYLFCVDAQGIYRDVVTYQQGITLFPETFVPIGLSMAEVLPQEVAERQLSYLQEVLHSGDLRTYEQQIQCGDQVWDEEVRVIKSGEDEVLFMVRDISDRKQTERQLQNLIEGTAATTGQDFFPALVHHLVSALNVAYAVVTELVDETLHTLAFCSKDTLHDPIAYHPVDTPCERTLQNGRCFIEVLQPQDFPGDLDLAEMNVNSYLGIALHDSQCNVLGTLYILNFHPIQSFQRAEQILQVFGARAAAELERQRVIDSLEQLNQTLEFRVAKRTAALREREQFLQTVLDTFPLSIFWKDRNSVYLGCNRNFANDAGLEAVSDVIGKTDYDMPWRDSQAEAYRADDHQVMISDTAMVGIVEHSTNAAGRQLWLETSKLPLRNLADEVVGVLGTYQDITRRKQLEVELQTSRQTFSEVLDSAIAGISRLRLYPDMSIQYDYISPQRADLLGYTVEELLSLPDSCQTLVEADDWTPFILPLIEAILKNYGTSTHQVEYRLRRKDGSNVWVLANCFAQWNAMGGYWNITNVETDISDRKKAESQLQNLILGTAAVGQDFFPALVRHIAEALEVAHVFAIECNDVEICSLAVWLNGELQSYAPSCLVGTPCERTLQAGIYHCEHSVQQQFSDCLLLQELDVESYLGIVLRDTQGAITGILYILHHQPLKDPQRAHQILQIFAARAAAELERQRANNALEKLNQALEVKVTERTAELQEREQFLQTVLDTFPLNVFWKDRDSVFLGANRNFLNNAGLAALADIRGKTDYDLPWRRDEALAYRLDDRQVMESNTPKLGIVETQTTADGQHIWIETNKLPLHNLAGEVIGVLGTFQDISDRKAAEAAIKLQLEAIEAAIDGISILQNDAYIYVNQAHLTLFGYTQSEELLGQSWRVLYSPEEVRKLEKKVFPMLERDRAWQGEIIATRKDGSMFPQGISLTLMEDGLLICVCRDISDLKQAQEQIIHNALHDPLTGLPNRRMLLERIELAIQRAQRLNRYQYAVLFLDLDRFKVINDSLGHVVGDQLLIKVSQRLKDHVRNTDMVARFGGDEFVILLEDVSSIEAILQVAERILADCRTPIVIDDHKIFTSTSIGIAMGSESYDGASDLIRDADIAMYRAKVQEHNSYKFFDTVMYAEAKGRLILETDLRKAVSQQELMVYYQPIVSLLEGNLVGFEALVRWQHPTRGLIKPSEFIPMAEETGLVVSLDSWILDQACVQVLHWQQQFPLQFPLKISINLSAQGLHKGTFLQDIDHLLGSTSLRAESITLEITESMLIEDVDDTIEVLTQLASRQIQISIDDFGTGYSSLSYLHRLPVHNLKIDRTFVGHMHLENRNYQVVSTILALSKQLGLTVVAEGIEAVQHVRQLRQLGCELGQGYLFAQPLTPHQVETILSSAPRDWLSIPGCDLQV